MLFRVGRGEHGEARIKKSAMVTEVVGIRAVIRKANMGTRSGRSNTSPEHDKKDPGRRSPYQPTSMHKLTRSRRVP